jgi:hypothetical protein
MTWFLRKAFSRGPIRINLSKSGLGVSVGVKGLRVGTGPKGAYVEGGRDGLYFRNALSGHAMHPESGSDVPVAAQSAIVDIVPAKKTNIVIDTPGFCTARKVGFFKNKLELTYSFPETFGKFYPVFIEGFRKAAGCSAIWNVATQTESRDAKYTAGANTLVERSLTKIMFDDKEIVANVPIVWLFLTNGKLAFLPEKMLLFRGGESFELSYKDVVIETSVVDFREEGFVPQDSINVGMTWQYVNKKGGPDHRFAHNKKIPIQQYSTLRFSHSRLSFGLEFSNNKMAPVIAECIKQLGTLWKQTPT